MQFITRAFIPFKNQDMKICQIVRENPEYTRVLNQHIKKFKPVLCFDWENEVNLEIRAEQDARYEAVKKGEQKALTVGELHVKFQDWVDRFKPQRLVHLEPERLMYCRGAVGVECNYVGSIEDEFYLPQHVMVTNYVYTPEYLEKHIEDKELLLQCSCIIAFIAEPFNS